MDLTGYGTISLFRSLANSCSAGLSPVRALQILRGPGSRGPAVAHLQQQVEQGIPFSEAMRAQPDLFPPWQTEIVAAGEATGRVDQAFGKIAEALEERRAFLLEIIPGLAYPLVLLHLAPFLLFLPKIIAEGPAAGVIAMLRFLSFFYGPALLLWLSWRSGLREWCWKARLPVLSGLAKGQFCFYLSALLRAGVAFHKAIELAGSASGLAGPEFAHAPAGNTSLTVTDTLRRLGVLSDEELGQLEAAEVSGKLDQTLGRIAEQSRQAWRASVKSAAALAPPLLYLLVVGGIAYRIIGFWSTLNSTLDQALKF